MNAARAEAANQVSRRLAAELGAEQAQLDAVDARRRMAFEAEVKRAAYSDAARQAGISALTAPTPP